MFPVTSLYAWMCALWCAFRGHIITCESGAGGTWLANTCLNGLKLPEFVKFDASLGRLKDAYLICTHIKIHTLTYGYFDLLFYVYNIHMQCLKRGRITKISLLP